MIIVKFSYPTSTDPADDEDRREFYLHVTGHAGSKGANDTYDMVCCAVSTLVYTLAWRIQEELAHSRLANESLTLDKGEAVIRVTPKPGEYVSSLCSFETILAGLRMLAKQFPDHVKVHVLPRKLKENEA